MLVPAVARHITPCRLGLASHCRTDIHWFVEVPIGIVAHATHVVAATVGVEAARTDRQVETCTVGVHGVDTELNMIS